MKLQLIHDEENEYFIEEEIENFGDMGEISHSYENDIESSMESDENIENAYENLPNIHYEPNIVFDYNTEDDDVRTYTFIIMIDMNFLMLYVNIYKFEY